MNSIDNLVICLLFFLKVIKFFINNNYGILNKIIYYKEFKMAQEESKFIKYLNNKVQIKEKAPVGENIAIYIRPGDKIDLEALGINLENAKFKLIGGDIVLEMAGAGNYTFVSLAYMLKILLSLLA